MAPRLSIINRSEKKREAIKAYAKLGTIYHTADAIGVSNATLTRWLRNDKTFAKRMLEAEEKLIQTLEAVGLRRALGDGKRGSDLLLIFFLRAKRPEVYNERAKVEHTGQFTVSEWVLEDRRETDHALRISGEVLDGPAVVRDESPGPETLGEGTGDNPVGQGQA